MLSNKIEETMIYSSSRAEHVPKLEIVPEEPSLEEQYYSDPGRRTNSRFQNSHETPNNYNRFRRY